MSIVGLGLWCLTVPTLVAQAPTSKTQSSAIFAPLLLSPEPTATRRANGSPGSKYWQNRADYDLKATLDTGSHRLVGSMVLRYTNHSPNTLDVIWLQTPHTWALPRDTNAMSLPGPIPGTLESFAQRIAGKVIPVQFEAGEDPGTTKVLLARPIEPGQTAMFESTFSVNDTVVPVYRITYWYPSVAVYDDINGWNLHPSSKSGAAYHEYGDFTLQVTVPANFTVAATGTLDNPTEVLSPAAAARLARARTSDTVVHIITRDALARGVAHRSDHGMLTWKFHARNVSNAECAVSNDFLWDATSWKGILVQVFHQTESPRDSSVLFARRSIQEYSEHWAPYPYPQVTVIDIDAPEGGYAFPMGGIVMWNRTLDDDLHFSILTHELAHQWFPMIAGASDETHPWMSEGFATFLQSLSEARWYPARYERMTGLQRIQAGMSGKEIIEANGVGVGNPYGPPAARLFILREYVLGHELFDRAFRTYFQRWAYKHPVSADFFRTIEDVSKRKLDWFWREWFYEPQSYDIAIDSVEQTRRNDTTTVVVVYRNLGDGVLPIVATLTYTDGTKGVKIHPAEGWQAGPVQPVTYVVGRKTVSRIEVDALHRLPDTDRSDNVWFR